MPAFRLILLSLLAFSSLHLHLLSQVDGALESVPDLQKALYLNVDAYPCVRLLNLTGEIGCSNPGPSKVVAPLITLQNAGNLAEPSAVVVPAAQLPGFLRKVSEDQNLARNIAGILVDSSEDSELPGFSPADRFPLAEFAPYAALNYEWNPTGSSIMWRRYDFPVFLLPWNGTLAVKVMAEMNERSTSNHFNNVAEFDLVMRTTAHGTRDSESCLRAQSCLPLGGYSVWSSLPPINLATHRLPKPIVLAVTSMDSASFFRDRSIGADSPLSGLIALLAAVDALSHLDNVQDFKNQLVFVVFTGESWGYIGSRKFLAEMEAGTYVVDGLNTTLIEQVLEIGSVGKALKGDTTSFFAHFEKGAASVNDIISALEHASRSLPSSKVQIHRASTENPGIPPSSLMTFIRNNSSVAGVVLEEFDRAYTNEFYESHLDDQANINSSAIVSAASIIARTLYILAMEEHELPASVLDSIKVDALLIEDLVGCLLSCEPGLSCTLVESYISPSTKCPNHYVGVFLDNPSDGQGPQYVDDTSRFLWNFLAEKTSVPMKNASACSGECSNEGEICIGFTSDRKGKCLFSSTRYVPSYSTRLKYVNGLWHVLPVNSSDPLGAVDPVWTESYWDVIGLRAYKVQSASYDIFALLAGVTVTIVTYVAVIFARAYLMKVVKHD